MVRTIAGKKRPFGDDRYGGISADDVLVLENEPVAERSAKDNAMLQRQLRLGREGIIKQTGLNITGRDLTNLRNFYIKMYGITTGDVILQRKLFEDFIKNNPAEARNLLVEMRENAS